MRVVVITGSRDWDEPEAIADVLRGAEMLIVGDCPSGADVIALELALASDVIVTVLAASPKRATALAKKWQRAGVHASVHAVADWDRPSKQSAGTIRNQVIADRAALARADGFEVRCFAFPLANSIGTPDCIRRLRKHGLHVDVYGGG